LKDNLEFFYESIEQEHDEVKRVNILDPERVTQRSKIESIIGRGSTGGGHSFVRRGKGGRGNFETHSRNGQIGSGHDRRDGYHGSGHERKGMEYRRPAGGHNGTRTPNRLVQSQFQNRGKTRPQNRAGTTQAESSGSIGIESQDESRRGEPRSQSRGYVGMEGQHESRREQPRSQSRGYVAMEGQHESRREQPRSQSRGYVAMEDQHESRREQPRSQSRGYVAMEDQHESRREQPRFQSRGYYDPKIVCLTPDEIESAHTDTRRHKTPGFGNLDLPGNSGVFETRSTIGEGENSSRISDNRRTTPKKSDKKGRRHSSHHYSDLETDANNTHNGTVISIRPNSKGAKEVRLYSVETNPRSSKKAGGRLT
jgi:hypothetical protein